MCTSCISAGQAVYEAAVIGGAAVYCRARRWLRRGPDDGGDRVSGGATAAPGDAMDDLAAPDEALSPVGAGAGGGADRA